MTGCAVTTAQLFQLSRQMLFEDQLREVAGKVLLRGTRMIVGNSATQGLRATAAFQ